MRYFFEVMAPSTRQEDGKERNLRPRNNKDTGERNAATDAKPGRRGRPPKNPVQPQDQSTSEKYLTGEINYEEVFSKKDKWTAHSPKASESNRPQPKTTERNNTEEDNDSSSDGDFSRKKQKQKYSDENAVVSDSEDGNKPPSKTGKTGDSGEATSAAYMSAPVEEKGPAVIVNTLVDKTTSGRDVEEGQSVTKTTEINMREEQVEGNMANYPQFEYFMEKARVEFLKAKRQWLMELKRVEEDLFETARELEKCQEENATLRQALEGMRKWIRDDYIARMAEKGKFLTAEQINEVNNNFEQEGDQRIETIPDWEERGETLENSQEDSQGLPRKEELCDEKKPDKMDKEEWEYESKERLTRKQNIIVRGIRTSGNRTLQEVRHALESKLNITVGIERTQSIAGGILVRLYSVKNKIQIIEKKSEFKGTAIWLEDDLTMREKLVPDWLNLLAELEKKKGNEIKVGFQKICINGNGRSTMSRQVHWQKKKKTQ